MIESKSKPTALFFNPYLRTLGGGERYFYAAAEFLAASHDITIASIALPDVTLMKQMGFPCSFNMRLIPWERFVVTTLQYDMVFYLTNEIPHPSLALHNFLMAQFPFDVLSHDNHLTRKVQKRILSLYSVICNSEFSQHWLKQRWEVDANIITPPINTGHYNETQKEFIILAVGRFCPDKRQDILIKAYCKLPDTIRNKWQLIIAGGLEDKPEIMNYYAPLQAMARNENIRFIANVQHDELYALYQRASIFWHAKGYKREADRPWLAEHFGITTVEAMSFGCVPLVYNDGGQQEIVREGIGYTWREISELIAQTTTLLHHDALRRQMSMAAAARAKKYDIHGFRCKLAIALARAGIDAEFAAR